MRCCSLLVAQISALGLGLQVGWQTVSANRCVIEIWTRCELGVDTSGGSLLRPSNGSLNPINMNTVRRATESREGSRLPNRGC